MFIATTLVKNNSDLMKMGHHGYQPAGGGGDGVLAVTSSSLSEIKVWLTHTPTYHWTPFPAETKHSMHLHSRTWTLNSPWSRLECWQCLHVFLTRMRWMACDYVAVVYTCVRMKCDKRQKQYVCHAGYGNTCGWKEVWLYFGFAETHEHYFTIHINYCRRFILLQQEQI